MKRLIIEQLKEGYNLIDESGEKYAVSESMLSTKVRAHFGLTKVKPKKEKNNIAPPAKGSETTQPETQGNKTPDSHSGGAIPMTKRGDPEEAGEGELPHHHEDISQSSSTEQVEESDGNAQRTKQNDDTKLGTPDNHIVVRPSDLEIPKFKYDESKMQSYENIFLQESPDGAVVLKYGYSHYYTTKENIFKIPYPIPKKYFSKENGWSSNVEQAFKIYRQYLAEQETKNEKQMLQKPKQEQEDQDDWKYKPFLKTNTRTNYDGNKIEGTLEG